MLRYEERLLQRDERPLSTYTYYVTGRGAFPVDMLRHDQCWPCTSDDAVEIFRYQKSIGGRDDYRSVKLRSYRMPTEGRWSSFMWSVGKESL